MLYTFGHEVKINKDGNWVFVDTGKLHSEEPNKKCAKCNKPRTKKGHDPCIANLPGVKSACCGHGVQEGYISFDNNIIVWGALEAEEKIDGVGKWQYRSRELKEK